MNPVFDHDLVIDCHVYFLGCRSHKLCIGRDVHVRNYPIFTSSDGSRRRAQTFCVFEFGYSSCVLHCVVATVCCVLPPSDCGSAYGLLQDFENIHILLSGAFVSCLAIFFCQKMTFLILLGPVLGG